MQTQNFQISQKARRHQKAERWFTKVREPLNKDNKNYAVEFPTELSYQQKQNRCHVNKLHKNPIFQK